MSFVCAVIAIKFEEQNIYFALDLILEPPSLQTGEQPNTLSWPCHPIAEKAHTVKPLFECHLYLKATFNRMPL